MNRLVLVAVLLIASYGRTVAADMPVKAVPSVQFPYYTSGPYWGIGSFMSATNPTVDGNTAGNLQALGASIGLIGGYRYGGKTFGIDFEGSAFYNNVGGDTACAAGLCSVGAKFSSIERIKIGTDMQTIVAIFPSLGLPNLPSVPSGILANVSDQRVYLFGGVDIDDVSASFGLGTGKAWQVSPGFGIGTELLLKNLSAVDIWAGYFNPSDGFSVGPMQISQGRKLLIGANWLF